LDDVLVIKERYREPDDKAVSQSPHAPVSDLIPEKLSHTQ